MNIKHDNQKKAERISVALDKETREKLDKHRERIKREVGLDCSINEAVASLIRTGVKE